MILLPALFLLWPFLEIAAFITVGGQIGLMATLLLTFASACLGAMLLRVQGTSLLMKASREMRGGGAPEATMAHGALMALGAFLLIIPGFLSDLVGLALFLPPVRDLVLRLLARNASFTVVRGRSRVVDLDPDEWQATSTDPEPPSRPSLPPRRGD